MNFLKIIIVVTLLCALVLSLVSCRNNLVNKWENYTGDTDYYQSFDNNNEEMTFETFFSELVEDPVLVSAYGLPEYWNNELLQVVYDTDKVLTAAGSNRTAFLWYNDSHLSYSARSSSAILKFLQENTNISYVNFGGDIVSDYDEVEHSEIIAQLYDWRKQTLSLSNHHSVVGNHDDDIGEFLDRNDLYAFLLEDEVGKTEAPTNKFCYYVDNASEKTRYIYLSTGFDETTCNDIRFLADTLMNTEADWHIVVVSHIWFVYNSTLTPTEGEVPEFAQTILNVLDDYNSRTMGCELDVEYDFAFAKAKVEFCIGGHTHVDFNFYTDGGIPVVLTETDSYHLRGEGKNAENENEAAISVIVADYNTNLIHIIRAGRGDDRTVPLS